MYLDQNSTKAKTTCVFTQWVYANLDEGAVVEGSSLATFFTISVWWRWKWWCGNIFGQNGVCRDRVKFVKDTGKEVALAKLVNMGNEGMISREERMIGWSGPQVGWIKVNTNGASKGNLGLATAAGVCEIVMELGVGALG